MGRSSLHWKGRRRPVRKSFLCIGSPSVRKGVSAKPSHPLSVADRNLEQGVVSRFSPNPRTSDRSHLQRLHARLRSTFQLSCPLELHLLACIVSGKKVEKRRPCVQTLEMLGDRRSWVWGKTAVGVRSCLPNMTSQVHSREAQSGAVCHLWVLIRGPSLRTSHGSVLRSA